MFPLKAKRLYYEEIEVTRETPEQMEYDFGDVLFEPHYANGFILDILRVGDAAKKEVIIDRVEDQHGQEQVKYGESAVSVDGVYAIFLEPEGELYKMSVQNLDQIYVDPVDFNEYRKRKWQTL